MSFLTNFNDGRRQSATTGKSTLSLSHSAVSSLTSTHSLSQRNSRREKINVEHLNRGIIYGERKVVTRARQKKLGFDVSSREEETTEMGDPDNQTVSDTGTSQFGNMLEIDEMGFNIDDDAGYDTALEDDGEEESFDHSGRQAYLDACRLYGVIPISYFLRHFHQPVLDLKHRGLGPLNLRPIATSLVSNSNINSLNLTDNSMGKEGGRYIADMLTENCYISTLNLSYNHLEETFAELLVPVLRTNITISHLDLSHNSLGDKAAPFLAEIIADTSHLEDLNLSHNLFSEKFGTVVGPAMAENTSIKSLDISWNAIRRKSAIDFAKGLKTNLYLLELNISYNGFSTDGARALGIMLKTNHNLEVLNISNNRIGTEGSVLLSKGLLVNQCLRVLIMNGNPMQSAGCYAICVPLLKSKTSVIERLEFLDIEVNEDFKVKFMEVKQKMPHILIKYGDDHIKKKPKKRLHPMKKLSNYVDKHNLRLIDFFNKFDKDGSMSVDYEEFREGLKELGIKFDEEEIDLLINELDRDGDGEINYSELAVGNRILGDKDAMIILPSQRRYSSTLNIPLNYPRKAWSP